MGSDSFPNPCGIGDWRFGTLWPAYVTHAIVDTAIFALGYHILFL